ncbi:hypothetical protein PCANB_000888 [Pneumocystis canis]|nr:hypothetical protein PCANB_000888 [Pneumocystis canis]
MKSDSITLDDLKSFISTKIYSNHSLVLIGLRKVLNFFIDCERRFNEDLKSYGTLLSYFNTETPCQEIFELWTYFCQCNDSSIIFLVLEILVSVIRVSGLLGTYISGNKIIKRILNFYIKSIYHNLASDIDILIVGSMRLLIEMSCFNLGFFILEIFNSFDFSHKVIFKILKDFSEVPVNKFPHVNRQFLASETPRTFMIRFIFCFLKLGPVSLKMELLGYRDIFYNIFSGLVKDDIDFVREILNIITHYVILEKDIPRSIKVVMFNERVLNKLLTLYLETNDKVSRSIVIHNFLILLCTQPGIGICFQCNGWYPKSEIDFKKIGSSLIHNKILSSFIFKLKITQDILQQELFLKICQACPELIAHCAFQFSTNIRFEPCLSVSWLSISSIYQSLVLLPVPFMAISGIPPELVFTSILENIIPHAVTRVSLTSGLRNDNNLVVFFTANLIISSMDKYCLVITTLDKRNDLNTFIYEFRRFQQLLKEMFFKRLPDIHVIFFVFKLVWGKSSSLLKFSLTKLLVYYLEVFPEVVFFQKYDYSSILVKGFSVISEDVSYGSLILCYLFRISHKFLPISKWWNKKQKFSESIFTVLIKLYLFCKNEEFRKEYRTLISCLLRSSNVFSVELRMDPGELILKTLDDVKCFSNKVEVVVNFLGDSLMLFMNSSYKYMDDLVIFISEYKLEINQRIPSLILILLIKQWCYFFSHSMSSMYDKILVASWLSRVFGFFAFNDDTWEISKILCLKLAELIQEKSFEFFQIFNETRSYIEFLDGTCSESSNFFLTIKECENISFTEHMYLCRISSDNFVLIDFILHGGISQLCTYFDDVLYHIQCKHLYVCLLDVIVLKRMIYIFLSRDKKITCDFNDVISKYFRIIKSIGNVLRDTTDFQKFREIIIEENKWGHNYLNFRYFIHLVLEFINPLDSSLLLGIMNKTYESFIDVLTNETVRDMSLTSDEWNEIFLILQPYWPKDQFLKISTEILKKYIQEIHVLDSMDSDIFGFFGLVFNQFFITNDIKAIEISELILIFNLGLKFGYLNRIFEFLYDKISSLTDDAIHTLYEFIGNNFFLILQNTDNAFSLELIFKIYSKSFIFLEIISEKLCEIAEKSENISRLMPFFFTNLLYVIDAYVLWRDYTLQNKKQTIVDTLKSRLIFLLKYVGDDLLNECFDESDKGFILFRILSQSIKMDLFEDGKKVLDRFCISCDKIILNKRIIEIIEITAYKYGNEFIKNSALFVSLILSKSSNWKGIDTGFVISPEHRLIIVQLLHYFVCNSSEHASLFIMENIYNIYTGTINIVDQILLDILQRNEETVRHNFFSKKIVLNIQSNIKKTEPLKFSCRKNDIIVTLSLEFLNRSIYFFPLMNKISLEFSEIHEDKSWLYCDTDQIVYDPLFFLPLILAYITLEEPLLVKFLINSNIFGYILVSLSSVDNNIRKMSLTILSVIENKVSVARFSEKSQLMMFFQVLKSSVSLTDIEVAPIPYVISLFMALSIQIIINPSHFLFDEVCRFYLQRPKLDFHDIPMFYSLWNATRDYYKQSNWLISLLSSGLRTVMDYELYKKRHVFELLCCLFSSNLVTNDIRFKIIALFCSASNIYGLSTSLARDYGMISWIEQQIVICSDYTLKIMLRLIKMGQEIILETPSSHVLLDITVSISSYLLSKKPIAKPFKLPESKLLQQSEFLIIKYEYWKKEINEALQQIHYLRKNKKWTLERKILTDEKIKFLETLENNIFLESQSSYNILTSVKFLGGLLDDLNLEKDNYDWLDIYNRIVTNSDCNTKSITISNNIFHIPPRSSFILGNLEVNIDSLINFTRKKGPFDIIIMDPPWKNKSSNRKAAYLSLKSNYFLMKIPIHKLLAKKGIVGIWLTNKKSVQHFIENKLLKKWKMVKCGSWCWLKVTDMGEPIFNIQSFNRKPFEEILFAQFSNEPEKIQISKRIIAAVPDLHSRKPCLKNLLNSLIDNYKGCEFFSRNLIPGWFSIGNQTLKAQWSKWNINFNSSI